MKVLSTLVIVALVLSASASFLRKQESSFITQTITINPGQTQSFSNPLPFSISATCTVADSGADKVCATLTQGSGTINGQSYNQGQSVCLSLTNSESLSISASGSASISLDNEGSDQVTLTCNANLEQVKEEQTNFITQTITINPGQTQSFSNPLPFSISATCTVADSGADKVCATLSQGSGTINGQSYNQGQSVCLSLTNSESLSISASGSASISLDNEGADQVTLTCNANLEQVKQEQTNFITQTITINPGQTQSFSNPLPFSISATCTVADSGADKVCATLSQGSGTINGQSYNQGQSVCLSLTNSESLSISASGSASISLDNEGADQVTLTCNANLEQVKEEQTNFITQTITINPGQTQSFSNPLPFSISATCTVADSAADKVCATLTQGSGTINGQSYNQGQSVCFSLTNSESLSISASGSASISLDNEGADQVTLTCNANLEQVEEKQKQTNFITQTITIQAGQSQSFSNPLPFQVSATCTVSDSSADNLCGTLTSGSGSINGKPFSQGQQACYVLTNGESLSVTASGSANISFQNEGTTTVTLTCNANLEEEELNQVSQQIVIPAGQTKSFSNPLPFSVSGSCGVVDSGSDQVCGTITAGTAQLNGTTYNTGQSACLTLTNNENLSVEAGASAAISFTNKGQQTVTLNCNINLQEIVAEM